MRLRFIWVGKTKNRNLASLEDVYLKRISRFVKCETVPVTEIKKTSRLSLSAGLSKEGKAVLNKLNRESYSIALDETGVEMNSLDLARLIQEKMTQGTQEIVFIGFGCHGKPEGLQENLSMNLSLSRFTLPHELARVVLLEQIYRAFCLINGMPYHK